MASDELWRRGACELAALIRARWPLPLVALTARADPEAEPAAFAAGMVAFVRKPVDGATLAETMARVLRVEAVAVLTTPG